MEDSKKICYDQMETKNKQATQIWCFLCADHLFVFVRSLQEMELFSFIPRNENRTILFVENSVLYLMLHCSWVKGLQDIHKNHTLFLDCVVLAS